MAGAGGAGRLTRENRTTTPVAEKQGAHAQAFGPAIFYAPGKCLSCFSGCLSFEQACLFTPFSKRMEVGQQIVCFRWFHSFPRVKGRASGIHRLRFTPFRRRPLMCNAAAASHRRTSRMVPSCPRNQAPRRSWKTCRNHRVITARTRASAVTGRAEDTRHTSGSAQKTGRKRRGARGSSPTRGRCGREDSAAGTRTGGRQRKIRSRTQAAERGRFAKPIGRESAAEVRILPTAPMKRSDRKKGVA